MQSRCGDYGPRPERCLLPPCHEGFHKSNQMIWPNQRESDEHWADIARRLIAGESMIHLSYNERLFAYDALRRCEPNLFPEKAWP